jgi:hypothetical protein
MKLLDCPLVSARHLRAASAYIDTSRIVALLFAVPKNALGSSSLGLEWSGAGRVGGETTTCERYLLLPGRLTRRREWREVDPEPKQLASDANGEWNNER